MKYIPTMITQAYLKEVLSYDPETGLFTWRVKPGRSIPVGAVAGWVDPSVGYRRIGLLDTVYHAHRLAWLYVTGEWPEWEIDHINGDRGDNRIANLREATSSKNKMNMRRRKDNKTGFKGVTWWSQRGCFRAIIQANGKQKHLGCFKTAEEAHATYCEAASRLHGDFAKVA